MSIQSALKLSHRPARAFTIIGLFWGAFAAQVPVIKDQLGAGDALFGQLLLGSSIGLVSAMWLAPRVDQWLGARGMQIAAVMFAVFWMFPPLITTPLLFAFAIMMVGMASGVLDVIMNARVSELESQSGRTLMNANHAMFSVGYAISALLTGVAREAGLQPIYVFAIVGLVTLALTPGLIMTPAEVDDADEGGNASWSIVLLCGAVTLIAFMSEATVEAWSALHIERTLLGRAAEGALGPAMLGITMAIGRFSGQAVSERFRETSVVIVAALIAAGGALIAAGATSPMMGYLGFGVLGLGVSVIGPIGLAIVGKRVSSKDRTKAISRVAVIGFSGFFIAPTLMGFSSEYVGLRWSYVGVAGVLLLAIPFAVILRRR
ncbi:MFS transporter [Aestuariibius sp. HNIBRBA575]|uniref:MFS transporter n=1 Tax=Aestuariibius sp. HNIBRBA575 TaxID=3233343 RepID=UPI0034A47E79